MTEPERPLPEAIDAFHVALKHGARFAVYVHDDKWRMMETTASFWDDYLEFPTEEAARMAGEVTHMSIEVHYVRGAEVITLRHYTPILPITAAYDMAMQQRCQFIIGPDLDEPDKFSVWKVSHFRKYLGEMNLPAAVLTLPTAEACMMWAVLQC